MRNDGLASKDLAEKQQEETARAATRSANK